MNDPTSQASANPDSALTNQGGQGSSAAPAAVQDSAGGGGAQKQLDHGAPAKLSLQDEASFRLALNDAIKGGRLTPEQRDEVLKSEGLQPLKAGPPDNSIAAQMNAAFPRARPEEYQLDPIETDFSKVTPEIAQWDRARREVLTTAGFPKEIGSVVMNEVEKVSARFQSMSETERAQWASSERETLSRVYGERTNERLALAKQLIDELRVKSPLEIAALENSGALASAFIVGQISEHAWRLNEVAEAKKKGL